MSTAGFMHLRTLGLFIILMSVGCSVLPPLETKPLQSNLSDNAFDKKSDSISRDPDYVPRFIWPLKDGVVTQEYKLPKGRRRGHRGIDIAAPKGDDVFASHDGLVIFAGRQFRGFGRLIIVENSDGSWATFYSHLLKIITKQGQRVEQGQLIGRVGKTGRATGYHLHFEVRHNKSPLNPLTVLP